LDRINVTDGDYGYFASLNATTYGYAKISVSANSLQGQFIRPTVDLSTMPGQLAVRTQHQSAGEKFAEDVECFRQKSHTSWTAA